MKLHILYYKISSYVCVSNDVRLGTFLIEKFKNKLSFPIGSRPSWGWNL
jgi:hypothetical protein